MNTPNRAQPITLLKDTVKQLVASIATGEVFQVGTLYLVRLAAILTSALAGLVLTRLLGPEGRADLTVSLTAIHAVVQFGNLGMATANTYGTAKRPESSSKAFGNSLWLSLTVAALFAVGLVIAGRFSEAQSLNMGLCTALTLAVLANLQLVLIQSITLGLSKVAEYNLGELITSTLTPLSCLFAVLLAPSSLSTWILLSTAPALCAALYSASVIHRNKNLACLPSLSHLKRYIGLGLRAYLGNLFGFLAVKGHVIVAAAYSQKSEIGKYALAWQVLEITYTLAAAAGTLLFAKIASIDCGRERWRATRSLIALISGPVFFVLLVSVLFCRQYTVALFGDEFESAYLVIVILAPGVFFLSIGSVLINYLASDGMPWSAVAIPAVCGAMCAAGSYIFAESLGANGMAISATTAYASLLVLSLLKCMFKVGKLPKEAARD